MSDLKKNRISRLPNPSKMQILWLNAYPWRGSNHTVWKQEEVQSNSLEDVLEERDDLQGKHILAHIISHLYKDKIISDNCLNIQIISKFGKNLSVYDTITMSTYETDALIEYSSFIWVSCNTAHLVRN